MATGRYYLVTLSQGISNKKYQDFFATMSRLNGRQTDYTGHGNLWIVKFFRTADELHWECSMAKKGKDFGQDVTVTEITEETLADEHAAYLDVMQSYFKAFEHI